MTVTAPPIRQAPLGPQTQPRMSRHDIICVHTMVGYLLSTDRYFRTSNGTGYDGTESHYGVGGKWGPDLGGGWDGRIWQWQSLAYTADANYQGNLRVVSIETADNSPALPQDIQPWTPAQLAALIDLIAWLCTPAAHASCPASWRCHQVGIPAQLIPDTQSSRRGLAYHAQGAAEHTVGEWWSTTPSKGCPTPVRIRQFKTIVVPGVQRKLAGQEEDPLAGITIDDIGAEITRRLDTFKTQHLDGTLNRVKAMEPLVGQLAEDVTAIKAELDAASPTPSPGA